MFKKNLKIIIITSVVTILPIIAGLVLWNKLPETLPTHWGFSGEVDGWSSKPFAVFFIPAFIGILDKWGIIKMHFISWIALLTLTTLLVMVVSGWTKQLSDRIWRKK